MFYTNCTLGRIFVVVVAVLLVGIELVVVRDRCLGYGEACEVTT